MVYQLIKRIGSLKKKKIDHILGNKGKLHRFIKISVSTCVLSDHHGLKLEGNNNATPRKPPNS